MERSKITNWRSKIKDQKLSSFFFEMSSRWKRMFGNRTPEFDEIIMFSATTKSLLKIYVEMKCKRRMILHHPWHSSLMKTAIRPFSEWLKPNNERLLRLIIVRKTPLDKSKWKARHLTFFSSDLLRCPKVYVSSFITISRQLNHPWNMWIEESSARIANYQLVIFIKIAPNHGILVSWLYFFQESPSSNLRILDATF